MATGVRVTATYASINCVSDICEPWIELWGGDEWGESMSGLHAACHTSYGFSDEDCALFATKLIENLEYQREWAEDNPDYSYWGSERMAQAQARCRELREYWLKGGNLTNFEPAVTAATNTLATMPSWLFGE